MRHFRTLYGYELKKICKRKLVRITMGILISMTLFMAVGTPLMREGTTAGGESISGFAYLAYEKQLEEQFFGRKIDDELLTEMKEAYADMYSDTETAEQEYSRTKNEDNQHEIVKRWEQYRIIAQYVVNVMQDTEAVSTITSEQLYQARLAQIEKEWTEQKLTEGEREYWREKEHTNQIPFTYGYTSGWESILTSFLTLSFAIVLAITISLSGIFSDEHVKKTDQLILCSKYGKQKLFMAKLAAGVTFTVLCSVLFLVIEIGLTLCFYGTEGADTAIQICLPFCSWNVTMSETVLFMAGVYLITSIFLSIFVMFLSEALKNSIAVMGILIGMLLLNMAVSIPYQYRFLGQILEFLPTGLPRVWQLLDFRLVKVFDMYFTGFQIVPVIYGVLGIVLVFGGNRIYENYQVSGR